MASVHEVTLIVADLARSAAFYETVIGFERRQEPSSRAVFDAGSCDLVLEEDFDETTFEAYNLRKPGETRGDGLVLELDVADVDAVHTRAREAGATILTDPRETWGRRHFLVEDPDGYVVGVGQPARDE